MLFQQESEMKKLFLLLFAALFLACAPRTGRAFEWRTDLAQAAADARQNQRLVLLNFSGSDWCGWCKKLDAEVFSQPAFQAFAASNLVAVLADFPRRSKQDEPLKAQNESLMRRFQVEGFPTVLLFSPEGELVGQLGYQPGGPEGFIQSIRQAQARHQMRGPDTPPGPRLMAD
jgi:thioredoxin-related protein